MQFAVIPFYKVVYLHIVVMPMVSCLNVVALRDYNDLTAKNRYDCTTFTEDMRKSILAPFFLKHCVCVCVYIYIYI